MKKALLVLKFDATTDTASFWKYVIDTEHQNGVYFFDDDVTAALTDESTSALAMKKFQEHIRACYKINRQYEGRSAIDRTGIPNHFNQLAQQAQLFMGVDIVLT